jgi:hypothetical protein
MEPVLIPSSERADEHDQISQGCDPRRYLFHSDGQPNSKRNIVPEIASVT